jgi:hypothetical protein
MAAFITLAKENPISEVQATFLINLRGTIISVAISGLRLCRRWREQYLSLLQSRESKVSQAREKSTATMALRMFS